MTEAELLDVAQAAWANVISCLAILITILSGYIAVAYVAAKDMTRSQVAIVNTLYVLLYGLTLMSAYTFTMRATEMGVLSLQLSTQRTLGPRDDIALLVVTVFAFCLVASLKFMWDIRHARRQD